jgi:ssDNA-binding Zn-finger/Zn-ribbon topoisomerase 1
VTKRELAAEHRLCDREVSPNLRYIYKSLHIRRRGCPECMKLKKPRY